MSTYFLLLCYHLIKLPRGRRGHYFRRPKAKESTKGQLFAETAAVASETATAAIGTLPAGQYAIRMYHDVNGNGEMDTNLMGIPSEPFAFSNNAQGRFGPASWEDSVFDIAGQNVTHSVRLD
mgnify:CR=1 FL=1